MSTPKLTPTTTTNAHHRQLSPPPPLAANCCQRVAKEWRCSKTMALRLLLQSSAYPKKLSFPFAPILQLSSRRSLRRTICTAMSTESSSSQLTHTITLPSRPAEPVHIVAAPGVSSSDFRRVSLSLSLSLLCVHMHVTLCLGLLIELYYSNSSFVC